MDASEDARHNEFHLAGRATYLKISLDRILENLRLLKSRCSSQTDVVCVLKGNAYGHGAVAIGKCLQDHGYDHFAVSTTMEGTQLRVAGVRGFILVLGNANAVDIPALYRHRLTPTVADADFISAWYRYAKTKVQTDNAELEDLEFRSRSVVIKIDTGLCRNGCQPRYLPHIVQVCYNNKVHIHSMMTHFSKPLDVHSSQRQMDIFMKTVKPWRDGGMKLHVASSAAILNSVGTDLDFVRPGLAMYGQASCMHTVCTRNEMIAVVPVGFADGYASQTHCQDYLTTSDGVRCPIIGKVSMDTITVCLPEADKTAREFTVMSADVNDVNACHAIAKNRGTTSSETLSNLSVRLPRLYELGGQLVLEN